MPDELIVRMLEQAPVVASLLFLVYRQEKRLSELQDTIIELVKTLRQ
jgi:hypothetical protein